MKLVIVFLGFYLTVGCENNKSEFSDERSAATVQNPDSAPENITNQNDPEDLSPNSKGSVTEKAIALFNLSELATQACDASLDGSLFYVISEETFYYCSGETAAFLQIDIKGSDGNDGIQGAAGVPGLQGEKGDIGATGERGQTGDKGEKGETGQVTPFSTLSSTSIDPFQNTFIANGKHYVANSNQNFLNLVANDAHEMFITDDSDCLNPVYVPYLSNTTFALTEGQETSLYFKFRTAGSVESRCYESVATITLDQTPPDSTSFAFASGVNGSADYSSSPILNWTSDMSDTGGSGLANYQIQIGSSEGSDDILEWTNINTTSPPYTYTDLNLENRALAYYLRIRGIDQVGNISKSVSNTFTTPAVGRLDTQFNSSGFATHHNAAGGNIWDSADAVAIDADGKIVVVGESHNGSNYDLAVWRYNVDGSLDTSFDGDGFFTHHNAAGGNSLDGGVAVAIDGEGKIIVAGYSGNGVDTDLALWRFHTDGSLDTDFDSDGIVIHHNAAGGNGNEHPKDMVLDADGKIIVVGESRNGSNNNDLAIWRFNTDGSLDASFDDDGIAIHHNAAGGGTHDTGHAVTLDADGKIVVAGVSSNGSNGDMVVWRFHADGSLDASFDSDGFATHNGAAGADHDEWVRSGGVAIDQNGKIIIAGYGYSGSDYDLVVWRYNADGSLDTSFDGDGFASHHNAAGGNSHDFGRAVTIDPSGQILVAGYSNNGSNNDMAVWRFNPDGSLDTGFDSDGFITHGGAAGGDNTDEGLGIAVDEIGRIIVVGESYNASNNNDVAVWRFE